MKTIVSTKGKVIQQGDEDGVVIANEDGVQILAIEESSDEEVINFFCVILHGGLLTGNEEPDMPCDFEILADRIPNQG